MQNKAFAAVARKRGWVKRACSINLTVKAPSKSLKITTAREKFGSFKE